MSLMDLIGTVSVVTAIFAYLNYKLLKLPMTSGVMLLAMIMSILLIGFQKLGIDSSHFAKATLDQIDFHDTLMDGMLSVLLFAGSLQLDMREMIKQKGFIIASSTVGLILSTVLVGSFTYCAF